MECFQSCSNLQEMNIPESVKVIGKLAFSGCKSLKKVVFPKRAFTVEKHAFGYTPTLIEFVNKPEGLKL